MPKVVTYADAMSNHGSLYVFCTSSETEKIADATERAGSWMSIFSSVLDPVSMIGIRAVAAFIPWKARRCLKRNMCLMISVAPISTLHEYDPYDSNDGWYKIYSRLFLVNGMSCQPRARTGREPRTLADSKTTKKPALSREAAVGPSA